MYVQFEFLPIILMQYITMNVVGTYHVDVIISKYDPIYVQQFWTKVTEYLQQR